MNISCIIVVFAIILMALGGLFDIIGYNYFLSREHLWIDGIFLLLLAIFLKMK